MYRDYIGVSSSKPASIMERQRLLNIAPLKLEIFPILAVHLTIFCIMMS